MLPVCEGIFAGATVTAAILLAMLHSPQATARARVLAPLYARAATAAGIPASMLSRVCGHESGHRYWAVGDSLGLCQVRRTGLDGVTFTRAELMLPEVNAFAAAEHLRRDLRACHGRVAGALAHYSRGHGCRVNGYSRRVLRS